MYQEHFGLEHAPFKITPDTRLFFKGGSRGAVLDALCYAISNGEGITKVVGEVGSGKTMLCRMLEHSLQRNVEVVYLANPSLSPDEVLRAIALELRIDLHPQADRLVVMHALQQTLLEKHADNIQVVVFVEEAQGAALITLEAIRLLSNLETQQDKLLQIVLFGQPELDKNLNAPSIRQLKERITNNFYLHPFSAEDIRHYIDFRLRAGGYRGPEIFTRAAYRRIARASRGLVRRVNILADKSLLAAYAENTHRVTPRQVKTALRDSAFDGSRWWTRAVSAAGLMLGVAVLVWFATRTSQGPRVSWAEPSDPGNQSVRSSTFTARVVQKGPTPVQTEQEPIIRTGAK